LREEQKKKREEAKKERIEARKKVKDGDQEEDKETES
jgi:hypothetical protein